jgi:hypothetical protein
MGDQLHQMTVVYTLEQDRLLFRVNTKELVEFRLWLTRLLVRKLWESLVKRFEATPQVAVQAAPGAKEAIMSMRHEQALQSSDFTKKHEPPAKEPEPEEEPLLVTGFECRQISETVSRLTLRTQKGTHVNLNLNDDLLHALCHLIRNASQQADWALGLAMGNDAATAPASGGEGETRQVH